MATDKLIVTSLGLLGIGLTYWFFLLREATAVKVEKEVDITVDGGYQPETISIPQGKTTIINFVRKDPSSCLEEVVLGDFKIKKFLPLNQKVSIEITPHQSGEYLFSCGMNMFHGKVIVR